MLHQISRYLKFTNGPQIILNRLFFKTTGPTIYRHSELTFLVDHDSGDQDGPRACVHPGLYDPFLAATGLAGGVRFIDLGANAGGFILAMLKAGFRMDQGIAVELNPLTWSRLVYNVYRNVPSAKNRISLMNGAVSGTGGTLDIRLGGGGVGDNIGGTETGELYHLEKFTLPNLLGKMGEGRIDLLKIDIEGSEYELLDIPADTLRPIDWLLIEIHDLPGCDPSEVFQWIESCGFEGVEPSTKPIESNVFLFRNKNAPQ